MIKKCIFLMLAMLPLMAISATKIDLNGTWKFKTDPYSQGESKGWHSKELGTEGWNEMPVPGNWDLYNEYSEYVGDAWYTRTFEANPDWSNKLVRLVFQSVYNDCKVWLNGVEIGENHIGFLPFEFDISKHLIYGQPNRITIKVDNRFKIGAIWNWGGIRRPVWLEVTDQVRIDYQHITAIPNLKKKSAVVHTTVAVTNTTAEKIPATLSLSILKDGKLIAKEHRSISIPPNTQEYPVEISKQLSRSQVQLWHFDFPELYQSKLSLSWHGKNHSMTSNFGIRKIEVVGNELLLNGEAFRPVGFNLVAEDRVTGNTLPFERIKEDVDMLKELGVTFCRISHLPLPKEYLDYLDKKGIMTFEEISLWGKSKLVDPEHPLPKEWLQRMIKHKFNHPSIAGWSVGNEIGYVNDNPKAMDYVKGAIAMAKQLDPNRLAVYVSHSASNQETDPVVYSDLIMLNKYNNWGKQATKAWDLHQKPIFMCEFGSSLNHEDPNLGIIPISKMMEQMQQKPYLIGASLWTFNDYRSFWHGGKGWATPVSQNRPWGIVNTFRQKKRTFYTFKRKFAPIKALNLVVDSVSKKEIKVEVVPRGKLEVPSRPLSGYTLQIRYLDQAFKSWDLKSIPLKKIMPDDAPMNFSAKLPSTKDIGGVRVDLLDPQGYSVLDTTRYLKVPGTPIVNHTNTASKGVALYFDKVPGATAYLARYFYDGKTYSSEPTINNVIQVTDKTIKQGLECTYEIVALNNFGESTPSKKIPLVKDEDELPPTVWKALRHGKDMVIGYTSSPYDYVYDIKYGYSPGKYTQTVTVSTRGVTRIPNVGEDPVYFRLRKRNQYGFASEWSNEIIVD